jgi:class 3 adenylate cyclase
VLLLYHRHLEQQVLETIVLRRLPRARMGVSTGPVVFQDGDYFGRTVNLAARITDYARPGEVLVSDEVVTASNAPQGVRYRPIGSIVLKGIETPVTLSEPPPKSTATSNRSRIAAKFREVDVIRALPMEWFLGHSMLIPSRRHQT